jgi:hypothetical protein
MTRYWLWAGPLLALSPELGPGGTLALAIGLSKRWRLTGSFVYSHARAEIDRGSFSLQECSLRVGPALKFGSDRLNVNVGLGARAGWLGLEGRPDDPGRVHARRFDTWYVGPALFATLLLKVAQHGFLALEVELADTIRQLHADVEGGKGQTLSVIRATAALGAGASW